MTGLLYGEHENWISAVVGRDVTPQPRRSPEGILPPARVFRDLSHLNEDLTAPGKVNRGVGIRVRDGLPLAAEVCVTEAAGPNTLARHLEPRMSPMYATNVNEFPPTDIACCDRDSLLYQSLAMGKALIGAGVETRLSKDPGADHEFPLLEANLPAARQLDDVFCWPAEDSANEELPA